MTHGPLQKNEPKSLMAHEGFRFIFLNLRYDQWMFSTCTPLSFSFFSVKLSFVNIYCPISWHMYCKRKHFATRRAKRHQNRLPSSILRAGGIHHSVNVASSHCSDIPDIWLLNSQEFASNPDSIRFHITV